MFGLPWLPIDYKSMHLSLFFSHLQDFKIIILNLNSNKTYKIEV